MNQFIANGVTPINFQQVYSAYIQPLIRELDLFLKTTPEPYTTREVASILDINHSDLLHIMQQLNLQEIDKVSFFNIVREAQSYICTLLTRQFSIVTTSYTAQNIAYIYNLDITNVENAFYSLGISNVSNSELNLVFRNIKLSQYNFKVKV